MFPRIVVNTFAMRSGGVSQLTEDLSVQFSELLAGKLGKESVIDHDILLQRMNNALFSPIDLQKKEVALWLADKAGANIIIFGTFEEEGNKLVLHVNAVRLSDTKSLAESTGSIEFKSEWKESSNKPLPADEKPRLAVGCEASTAEESKAAFDQAGVEAPTCDHCPDPSYNDEARRKKLQAQIEIKAMVDEQGFVAPFWVVKSGPPELIDSSLTAYRSWKLKPATKDGKPVAVCVLIDSVFKLL